MKKRAMISISQILILILGIVAISYAIGSEIRFVSAETGYFGTKWEWVPSDEGAFNKNTQTGIVSWADSSQTESLPNQVIEHNNVQNEFNEFKKNLVKNYRKDLSMTPTPTNANLAKFFVGKKISIGDISGEITKKGDEFFIGDTKITDEMLIKGKIKPSGIWSGYGVGFVGHIAQGFVWAGYVTAGLQLIGILVDDKEIINSLNKAAIGGILAGKGVMGILEQTKGIGWAKSDAFWGLNKGQAIGLGAGLLVAAIIFYNSYKETSTETVTFTCNTWDAPTGGSYCEKCNEQSLPCSEYQCRSLGQACQLVNPGSEEAKCYEMFELEKELKSLGIEIWFEEIEFPDGEWNSFVYGYEVENEKNYVFCERSYEYDEILKEENLTGVWLLFEEEII